MIGGYWQTPDPYEIIAIAAIIVGCFIYSLWRP